jgi:hypothetical protein
MSDEKQFPVASFAEAYAHLRRPFVPEAVHFKVQSTWDRGENKGGGMVIAYIDARLVTARLNTVCPQLWSETYEQHANGLICHLTIDGITRSDFGVNEGYENAKANFSDALKRAAVRFGVAESLYATPTMMVSEGNLLKRLSGQGKARFRLTPAGENHCRQVYAEWLVRSAGQSFGDPLDHGDAEKQTDAQLLADLIKEVGLNEDQINCVREWAKNGEGLDSAKVVKAIKLIEADEVELLLARAEEAEEVAA